MTLHFFKGHCYWELIYLSGEMRLDIKTNINSWVFNREALSEGVIEITLMTLVLPEIWMGKNPVNFVFSSPWF